MATRFSLICVYIISGISGSRFRGESIQQSNEPRPPIFNVSFHFHMAVSMLAHFSHHRMPARLHFGPLPFGQSRFACLDLLIFDG